MIDTKWEYRVEKVRTNFRGSFDAEDEVHDDIAEFIHARRGGLR